jgi:hypothetical protein
MTSSDHVKDDSSTDIFQKASALHRELMAFPVVIPILYCRLPEAVNFASHQLSRTAATMKLLSPPAPGSTAYGPPMDEAYDDAMAWFPPDADTGIDTDVLSSLLTNTGSATPTSTTIGWVQVYVDKWIWWGWRGENNLSVDWADVGCLGLSLVWNDKDNRRWVLDFKPRLASGPPSWPGWLHEGGPTP